MIDTHCHLTDPRLHGQLDAVLGRAAAAGVDRIVTIATHLSDAKLGLDICRAHANVRCAIGIHPNYGNDVAPGDLPALANLATDPHVVALGEMGLDFHYDTVDRALQERWFADQLALAEQMQKPVVIHSRESTAATISAMSTFRLKRAVFHCFTGTPDEVGQIVTAGYWVSFTGPVTYKNAQNIRDAVRLVPRDRLMVETDAPYLSPEPVRKQKTNEPAFVVHVAAGIAREWGVDVSEVDQITTENAKRFFEWS